MSANERRRISRLGLILGALFLTGCARAFFGSPRVVLSSMASLLDVGPRAHGSRSMASVARSSCDRASGFDLSKPDGAL